MVYRFIDDNKNIFGLRWLCQKFGISPNCYYNYKKDAKRKYRERLAHIFELIKYVYYNNNHIIGYRAMRIFIKRYGYELSNTTMHKYMNKELNLFSLHDLLYYFPYKYVDRSRLYYIHEIDGNMPYIQLKGEILSFETLGEGRQRRLVGHFSDGTGIIDLVWFQGIKYLLEHYKTRTEYIVFGKPTVFNGRINVAHPDMDPSGELTLSTMGLQPYYNTTERMKRGFLNSHGLEKLMKNALALLQEPLAETLPPRLVEEHHLMSLDEAIRNIHFPKNPELLRKAQYRLKFEELFYVQLNILRYSKDRQRKYRGLRFERVGEIFNTFYSQNLPFELTGAQKRVIKEIRKDMGSGRQMNRLLQGDVGSGKPFGNSCLAWMCAWNF